MSTETKPIVSIITATRNRPDHLENALRSIARQSFSDFEAIIVDDGSDKAVVERYKHIWQALDNRFVLAEPRVAGAPGTGPADARNRGLAKASGEFVAFLDDDDEWIAPDHLEVGLNNLKSLNADFFFANMQGHRNGAVTQPDWFDCAPFLKTRSKLIAGANTIYEVPLTIVVRALQRQVIHLNTIIVRKEIVRRFGGFLKHAWIGEDYNFAFHTADSSRRVLYRPDVVATYRFPIEDSISLSYTSKYSKIQFLMCVQDVRATCTHPLVRKSARAVEGWLYRTLSQQGIEEDRYGEVMTWALQGCCTYPTLSGLVCVARAILNKVQRLGRLGTSASRT